MQVLPGQPQLFEAAGLEAFDYHVGRFGQAQNQLRAEGMLVVQRDRAFVKIVEPERKAAVGMGPVVGKRQSGS